MTDTRVNPESETILRQSVQRPKLAQGGVARKFDPSRPKELIAEQAA